MRKILKAVLVIIVAIFAAAGLLLGFLTIREFRPQEVEAAVQTHGTEEMPGVGNELSILSWNIGCGGLGTAADFFMNGGSRVRAADKEQVSENILQEVRGFLQREDPDLVLLQEVDTGSTRSFGMDQVQTILDGTKDRDTSYAKNYSALFVPYPMPPIGHVESGLFTMSRFRIEDAQRIALPCPFSWPLRIANLKRCLAVNYIPVKGSEKKLVLINLHLEAYDSGEGKIEQTRVLSEFMENEYRKGNYVIAGGDFNQVFPGSLDVYPNTRPDLWQVGVLEEDSLPEGFSYACDLTNPTCRLLNQPYDPEDTENTQYYVIDGYIVSPNVSVVSVETVPLAFEHSDHNPVRLRVKLGGTGEKTEPRGMEDLEEWLNTELKSPDGTWSVYVKDLASGETVSVNDSRMTAASLIKLYVAGAYYEAKENGTVDWSKAVLPAVQESVPDETSSGRDKENSTASSAENRPDEKEREAAYDHLADIMINRSDNDACNALIDLIGKKEIDQFIKEHGFRKTELTRKMLENTGTENYTSVGECGKVLEDVCNGTYVSKTASEAILKSLKAQERKAKIPAGVPGNVITANKTGELAAVENDTAIIWGEDTTYILCVMSSDLKNTEEAQKEIVKISETVYAALNGSEDSPS